MIKNNGGHFRKIFIENCDYYFNEDEDCLNYARMIYENCPLIECLPLVFSSSSFDEFEKLLQTCQNLKALSIHMIDNEWNGCEQREKEKLEYGEKLSKALIDFAPKKLRAIWFSKHHFKFSLKTLETLLENWRSRTTLSIFTSDFDYRKDEYIKIINKYKNDGVIRDLHITQECLFHPAVVI